MESGNKNNNTGGCGEKKNSEGRKVSRSEALQKVLGDTRMGPGQVSKVSFDSDEKIDAYIRSEDYHCATYVFNQRNIFDDYKNSLERIHAAASNRSYKKAVEQKISLIFKEDLFKFPLGFSEDPFFSINSDRKFGEILKG